MEPKRLSVKRSRWAMEANIQLAVASIPVLHLDEGGVDVLQREIRKILGYAVWRYR
jgi:hypothetical protein